MGNTKPGIPVPIDIPRWNPSLLDFFSSMSGNGRNDKGRKNNPSSGSTGRRGRASPNSTDEQRHTTLLTPTDMPMITGVAGSNSQGAIAPQTNMADPLADLAGVMR
ncbi:unnamed protein product [Lactuca virosa]|uniref:Uncharacterized protein n=1 Tax=Lactuca virosa TaxID=75947 RepID=A0AAU9M3T4_9ASTR|nr:unnamed protein product [Lactuca virosa]